MNARLVGLDSWSSHLRIRLDKLPLSIGRGSKADVVVDDRWASRVHCRIEQRDGLLWVRDLESRNGTLVNGQHVSEAPLGPDDRITIGLTSFRVEFVRASMPSLEQAVEQRLARLSG